MPRLPSAAPSPRRSPAPDAALALRLQPVDRYERVQAVAQAIDAGVGVVGREPCREIVLLEPRRRPRLPGRNVALLKVVEREPGEHALATLKVELVGRFEHAAVVPRMPRPRRLQPDRSAAWSCPPGPPARRRASGRAAASDHPRRPTAPCCAGAAPRGSARRCPSPPPRPPLRPRHRSSPGTPRAVASALPAPATPRPAVGR